MSQVSAAKAQGNSSQTFLTALIINAAVLGAEVVAFVLLRRRLSRIYEPRTYLPPPDKRAVSLPSGWWQWLIAILAIPTGDVLEKNGMDAYMFLRFLRLLIVLFGSITLLTWVVLLPVDTAGLKDGNLSDNLSRLSWGNIPVTATSRYAAHIVVVYLSTFWTLYLIRREMAHYTQKRHEFLTAPSHATRAQARTVLITNVPVALCDEHALRRWASFVPGGVQNVWVYRDTRTLNGDYNAREEACALLEKATAKLIRSVVRAKRKADRVEQRQRRKTGLPPIPEAGNGSEKGAEVYQMQERPVHRRDSADEKEQNEDPFADFSRVSVDGGATRARHSRSRTDVLEAGQFAAAAMPRPVQSAERLLELYAPPKKWPRHRVGFLGLLGRKVDTIQWCKDEIARLNVSIEEKRAALAEADKKPRPLGSAFIQCNLQMGAHVLAQCVSYHKPLMMAEKWLDVAPKDVIWDNIDDGAYETRIRYVTSWLGSFALIVLWFAPVAFVGTLSNVATLCEKVSWLCWIRDAPTPIPGIIQGILPPVALAVLFAILPWLLRGLAWYENIPRWSLLSISVYKRYFLFLVIHGFLIVTLSSGLASTAAQIVENPTQAVSYLASQLPNASIFFLTWTLTQGLSGAGSALLQIGTILLYFAKKWFLGRTPRQAYEVTFMMPKADFGLVLPRISLLATIGLAYSVLSPIINGLAMLSFLLFFVSWKFLLTWVFDQPDEAETGGQYFPLAINFLFVGMYIEQFCLAVLFFLKTADGIVFLAEGVLMLVLMAVTMAAQILYQGSYDPITQYLPMSLATEKLQERFEHQQKAHHVPHEGQEQNLEDVDLFSRDRMKLLVHRHLKNPVAPVGKLAEKVQTHIVKTALAEADLADAYSSVAHSSAHDLRTLDSRKDAGDDENEQEDEDFDAHGFAHPSTYAAQPWIWVPRDALGLSAHFVAAFRAAGVLASDAGAAMDARGDVEVSRGPPDQGWAGGHDA